ncbi:MAG: thiamine/thiamine pyrophosphate ABC transporter permease ThiP [Oceanospirillaceae bacterium]|nr:thiamine/thiamine pyrophosphate ABC transporter permease ThiP [Oceanospirillaceae bacterium]
MTKLSNIWGLFFILLICTVTLLSFYGLIAFNGQGADLELLSDSYFHSILIFSIKQALLSALISTVLAWPIARAIYYYPNLLFKRAFLSLALLCFVLPTLVLITGFVSLLGRSGIITPLLGPDWNLYGLHGILLAHVYMNLPFAIRAFHAQLQNIPASSWMLASQLKLSGWQKIFLIEWPVLRANFNLTFGFIFILCFNSFAVVLALGGGPQSTTLEVAIYQALKYDFNIGEALTLAWSQLLIAGTFFVLLYRSNSVSWLSKDTRGDYQLPCSSSWQKIRYGLLYSCTLIFMLTPLLALLPGVFAADYSRSIIGNILEALSLTLVLGIICASVAIALAYAIMLPIRQSILQGKTRKTLVLQWLANHSLIAPAMVLSVGLYILFLPLIDLDSVGMIFVVILNIMMVLPFAIQQIRARLLQYDSDYAVLSQSLKLSTRQKLSIEWHYSKSVFFSTFALVIMLAMGDVAIFSIFGSDQLKTLPWLIYQYAGSYKINEASLASAVLLLLYATLLFNLERAKQHA